MGEPRASGEIYGWTFDECFRDLLFYLSRHPDFVCAPRGQKIKECLAQTLVLEDPTARLINNPVRKANYGFAAGEFLWYWRGADDLASMLYYNKRMEAFSDDGKTLNSAYGKRLRKETYLIEWADGEDLAVTSRSQWDTVTKTLVDDPDSRRAIMLINSPMDELLATTEGTKDVPCTLSLQFFVRNNMLHLHVHMRSNDAVWGLTNDLFSFTLFQECMLLSLKESDPKFKDLELGTYYHTAGSLHLYERHFGMAEECLETYRTGWAEKCGSPGGMPPLTSLKMLDELCGDEANLRLGYCDRIDLGKYTGGERWLAERLNEHRQKRDAEECPRDEKKVGSP